MDGGKLSAAIGVGLLCAGCASVEWPTPQEEVAVWLHEQPRVLALQVDSALPTPQVRVRDHKAGERVGKGALGGVAGAGLTVVAGCHAGPIGCLAGIVAAPVGAVVGVVVGAVSVDSVDNYHPIIEAQGAPELYQKAVKAEELQALFAAAMLAESAKGEGHGLQLAAAGDSGGKLSFSFSAIDLFGEVGEDPSVSLLLTGSATVTTPEATAHRYVDLAYQGSRRRVSEWKADEGKLFSEELASAAQAIAQKTLQQLRTAPPSGALEKVQHARSRRREAAAVAAAAPPAKLEFVPPPVTPAVPATPTVAAVAPEAPKVERKLGRVVGASWEYRFEDNIFSRRKHGFTVRAEAMEGAVVVESFQSEGGVRASERLTTRALAFSERRLLPGEKLVELGPYLLDPALLHAVPDDYPLGESREAWRVSKSPVIAEKVTVPAGTFEAFRVQLSGERSASGFVGHSSPMWNSLGVTRFRYTAWYVPEVGRYVKAHHEQWNASGAQIADESVQLVAYRAP